MFYLFMVVYMSVYVIIESNNIVGVVHNLDSINNYMGGSNTIIRGPVPILDVKNDGLFGEIEECNHMDVEPPKFNFGVPNSESLREVRRIVRRR